MISLLTALHIHAYNVLVQTYLCNNGKWCAEIILPTNFLCLYTTDPLYNTSAEARQATLDAIDEVRKYNPVTGEKLDRAKLSV
jgi:hypothetical protein